MHDLQYRRYSMFQAVDSFGALYSSFFPPGSLGRHLLNRITEGLAEIDALAPDQIGCINNARSETIVKDQAREALLADLRRIVRTARFIAGTIPGFDEPFKFPRSEGDAALLYTSRVFAERAAPHIDVFIKFSMPPSFIQDLNTHIRNIEQAGGSRSAIRSRQKVTTAAIDAAMQKCMKAVLDFDVVATNVLRDDKLALTAWQSARHVKRAPRKKKADAVELNSAADAALSKN